MRQESNNEMDVLLRRLSRRQDITTPEAGLRFDGDHLDPDELSSYAENVLPAAARARYTAHLADCASCRKLVAQLGASVGVASAQHMSTVSEPSALKKFLASLFSPMVLRYAVPALGLLVVAVLGVVVVRQNKDAATDSVAYVREQDRNNDQPASSAPPQSLASPEALERRQESSKSPSTTPEARANKAKETQPVDTIAAAPAGAANEVKTDAPQPKTEQQTVANAPTPPATSRVGSVAEEGQRRIEAETKKQSAEGPPAAPGSEVARTYDAGKASDRRAEDIAAARPASAKAKALESRAARGGGEALRRRADEKDRDDAETRSVAGRRFRKTGGIWIDTAYDSSRATINLTRGSEQYRALVADEPSIRLIAEQLDGEIIVIWKGRAYRIR